MHPFFYERELLLSITEGSEALIGFFQQDVILLTFTLVCNLDVRILFTKVFCFAPDFVEKRYILQLTKQIKHDDATEGNQITHILICTLNSYRITLF